MTYPGSVWTHRPRREAPMAGTPLTIRYATPKIISGGSWGSDFAPPPTPGGPTDLMSIAVVTGIA